MKKIVRVVMAAVLAMTMGAALVACGGVSDETKAAAGMYKLESVTVEGTTVTVKEYEELTGDDILSGFTLELTDAGKYAMAYAEADASGNLTESVENGDFSVSGSEIKFKKGAISPETVGSFESGKITVTVEEVTLIYVN
ncbi:MAG TPA: hypothetical protein DEB24_07405 [Coriobacteriia bacterium]|nr:hypothetical protein [Coriobacteriia bacterium]